MDEIKDCIAIGKQISYIDIPSDEILRSLDINDKMFGLLKSYNKCPKTDLPHLSERIILLNAAASFSDDNKQHEAWLKENINKKKNYLFYLKNNYTNNIFSLNSDIYNKERIEPFFTDGTSNEALLKLKNIATYNPKLNKKFGEYWLETFDPCHRPYIESYREQWLNCVKHPEKVPYFLWLEDKIQPNVPCIEYLTPERKQFYRVSIYDGIFFQHNKAVSNNCLSTLVMDEDGDLYLGPKDDSIRHTSFSYGRPVVFAGEASFRQGKLTHLANFSGHYCPTEQDTLQFLNNIKNRKCDTSYTQISIFNENTVKTYKNKDSRTLNLYNIKNNQGNIK